MYSNFQNKKIQYYEQILLRKWPNLLSFFPLSCRTIGEFMMRIAYCSVSY
jgi:hypothetical protein